jgi:hypothetical protein
MELGSPSLDFGGSKSISQWDYNGDLQHGIYYGKLYTGKAITCDKS